MYGGIIAPPLIMGQAAGLDTEMIAVLLAGCLFVGGLATILQSWGLPFFGSKLPLVQGTSFSGVATMIAIVGAGADPEAGLRTVFGSVMIASLIGFVIAGFFAKLIRFFPAVVTGVVITMIGFSLFDVAAGWAMGDEGSDEHGSVKNLLLALATFVIIVVLSKLGSAVVSRLSILLGMVLGTIVAVPFGMVDFSEVGHGALIQFPRPFAFGGPIFEVGPIISVTIVIVVTLTETTADILAVGEFTGAKVDSKRIANGLRADMASSFVGPFFNTFTQSAFAQNVGLVALTKVKSRFVVTAAGFILVVLGLLPVLGRVVAAIPSPVLGGAGLFLFGSVVASGIRTLAKVDYSGFNLIVVGASLAFGGLPVVTPGIYDELPTWLGTILESGISSATLMAVILNLVFNEFTRGNAKKGSVFAAAPPRMVTQEEVAGLKEGDAVQDGKLVDADGNEIPVVTAEHKIAVLTQHVEECRTNSIPIPDQVATELERTRSGRGGAAE